MHLKTPRRDSFSCWINCTWNHLITLADFRLEIQIRVTLMARPTGSSNETNFLCFPLCDSSPCPPPAGKKTDIHKGAVCGISKLKLISISKIMLRMGHDLWPLLWLSVYSDWRGMCFCCVCFFFCVSSATCHTHTRPYTLMSVTDTQACFFI